MSVSMSADDGLGARSFDHCTPRPLINNVPCCSVLQCVAVCCRSITFNTSHTHTHTLIDCTIDASSQRAAMLTCSNCGTHKLSLSHTNTHIHKQTCTHTFSLFFSLSLSLTHTYTHTHCAKLIQMVSAPRDVDVFYLRHTL